MRPRHRTSLVTLATLVLALSQATATPADSGTSALDAFARLKGLAGSWTGTTEAGAPITIDYVVAAHGTTVIETQSPGAPDEMLSVYSVAGDDLLLTHYCPMGPHGNQPHMRLDREKSTPSLLVFAFVSLANLDPEKDMHVHDGSIRIVDADHIERTWEIWNHGRKVATERFELARAGAGRADGAPAHDPQRVAVGDAAVDGSILRPYDNVWRYDVTTVADGVRHFQGLWTDHLESITRDGKTLWRRVQGTTYANGAVSSTINVFEPTTLAPVSSESRNPDGSFLHRDFAGGRIHARRIAAPGAKETTADADLGKPVFDFAGGLWGLLLASFPLRAGYSATLPSIAEFDDKLEPVSFTVRGKETVSAGCKGNVEAWAVDVGESTFWLTKDPPYIVKLRFVGPKKNVATWEMI